MKSRLACRGLIWLAVALVSVCGLPWSMSTARAQIIFDDEFDGTHGDAAFHPGGIVDVTSFRTPFGGSNGDDFVGRTNFRFTLPQDGVSTAAAGSTDGKVAVINLDTYNPNAPGASFLGTDLITKQNFAVGGGLSVTTRMRIDAGTPAGLVAAPFLYDVERESPPGTPVRDEIDHEILTNNAQGATPHNTLTNVWNDGNFASPGSPVMISNPPGFDVHQFHDYRTDWTPTSVKYYIDNTLVRTETSVVPNDPMRAHINFWAPDSTFAAAYNAALTPTATSPGTKYKVEVDRMQIQRINTNVSDNLLADQSFETFQPPASNDTGGWHLFNNAFPDTGPPPSAACTAPRVCGAGAGNPQDGVLDLKTYGHFNGRSDASGAYQNVPASPGQQFEGSVWAYTPTSDSIYGRQNFTNITLQFLDAAGNVIASNDKNTPIFDGRDANMPENEWVKYTVDAVAPAGTAYVRESLFFIQIYHLADYNNNNNVDAADYVTWRKSVGQANMFKRNPFIAGPVGPDDYTFWRQQFGSAENNNSTIDIGDPGAVWFDNASLVLLTPAGSGAPLGGEVPEPASWCLVAVGMFFANRISRRR